MPFVVPNVCRYAINQTLEGRAVVNVLDYQVDTTGSTMSRSEAVEQLAADILQNWAGTVRGWQVDDLTFDSVSWVDLNSATGTTGSISSGDGVDLPLPGLEITSSLPANTSVLVTKQAPSARGRRNGRMFIAGFAEPQTQDGNGNRLTDTAVTNFNATLEQFRINTRNESASTDDYSSQMVVVHVLTRGASPRPGVPGPPLTGDWSPVQALVVQQLLATQRRRLRG